MLQNFSAILLAAVQRAEEWILFAAAIFAGSSLAGVAQLLWEGKPIPWQRLVGAALLSGFAGAITSLMLYSRLSNDPSLLAAVSLLAGIGGATTIDLLSGLLRSIAKKQFPQTWSNDGDKSD